MNKRPVEESIKNSGLSDSLSIFMMGSICFVNIDIMRQSNIESIDLSGLELASRSTALKQYIHLSKRPSRRLGKAEIMVDEHTKASPSPEEASKVAPVPSCRIDHVGCEDIDQELNRK